jgi:hypothetical protein
VLASIRFNLVTGSIRIDVERSTRVNHEKSEKVLKILRCQKRSEYMAVYIFYDVRCTWQSVGDGVLMLVHMAKCR